MKSLFMSYVDISHECYRLLHGDFENKDGIALLKNLVNAKTYFGIFGANAMKSLFSRFQRNLNQHTSNSHLSV
jgi:hypothetical protein